MDWRLAADKVLASWLAVGLQWVVGWPSAVVLVSVALELPLAEAALLWVAAALTSAEAEFSLEATESQLAAGLSRSAIWAQLA